MERDYIDGRGRGRRGTGGWGVQPDEGTSPLSLPPSGGDFPTPIGKSRPDDQDDDDMYDFYATGSSRNPYKRSDPKKRKQKKKESKLAPKTKTGSDRGMTTEERVAEILARTRSPVASGGGTPTSAAAAAAPGRLNDSGRPWSPATASAGDEVGTGVFSDFAKSLREMRVEQLELSGDTGGGVLEGEEGISIGEGVDEWDTAEGKRQGDGGKGGHRQGSEEGQVGGGPLMDMSDSLVIEDADMEVGGYAREREELRRSKEVARGPGLAAGVGAGESSDIPTKRASEDISSGKDAAADPSGTVAAVLDAAGIEGDGASKGKGRDEGRQETRKQQRRRWDENSRVSVGQHGSGVVDGDGSLEESNQAAARVAEPVEGFAVGEGEADRSHSSEEMNSSKSPGQSWDESYEDEGFEAEEAEDDKEKGSNEMSQQLSEKRRSADPSRNDVTVGRKSDQQPRSGMLQPIPRHSAATTSAETSVAGADGGERKRDTESPRGAGDGGVANLVSGFLQSNPPRESTQSLPPAPPTSPPPSPRPPSGNRDGQGEAVAKITRGGGYGSGGGDCGDGWPDGDLLPTAGIEAATVMRTTIQLRPSTPPSPPPPPPLHLPEDELSEHGADGNASGKACRSLSGGRLLDAGIDTLSMMSHRQRQSPKEENGGSRGTGKNNSGTVELTVNERRQGNQAGSAAASGATQDTTPSSFRQRSRAHDDATSIIGGRVRQPAFNPVRTLTATEDPRTSSHERLAGATRIAIPSVGAEYGGGGSLSANPRVTLARSEYRRTGADDRDSDKRPQTEMDTVLSPACSGRDRILMAESPVVGATSASGDGGRSEFPTAAPSLKELEYQLRQLSPLRAAGDTRSSRTRDVTHTRARWKTVGSNTSENKQVPIGRSPRRTAVVASKHGGSRVRGGGEVGVHASAEGQKGSSAARSEGSYQGQRRQQALARDDLGFGGRDPASVGAGGSGFRGEEWRNPADLSSVVLVSSLSSTPSKRRSGSGRWASSGHAGRSIIGRVELGMDDLSAAHWELTEAERGMQARELGLNPCERGAADVDGEDKSRQERERELRVGKEEAERQIEKAKAEIYALQVKLEEKRAMTPTHASRILADNGTDRWRGGGGKRPDTKTSSKGGLGAQQKREEGGNGEAEQEGGRTALGMEIELLRAESEGMTREIAEQERLLAAYQKENEKLLEQAKKDKAEYEEERLSLYRDRERLNKECNRLANEVGGAGGGRGRSDAGGGGDGGGGSGSTAFVIQARLKAESALAEARARESELMFEIDRLRKAKRGSEAKVAALASAGDGGAAGASAALGAEVKRLQELLSQEREARAEEQRANRKKLDWYAENQELVDGHLEKIDEQERELTRLRDALSKEGGSRVGGRRPADMRKIKDLEAQLAELAEALRRRNPDCIANLIRAARPTMSQEMQRGEYAKKIGELEAELARQRTESELKLRALRQEHERVKTGLQRQLVRLGGSVGSGGGGGSGGAVVRRSLTSRRGDVGAGTGGPAARGSGAGVGAGTGGHGSQQQQGRVAELEKELSQVRAFYKRKLKDVERRAEAQMRALKRGGVYNTTTTTATANDNNSNFIDNDGLNGDKTGGGDHDFQQEMDAKQQQRHEEEKQQRQQQRQRRQPCTAGHEDTSSNNNRDGVTQAAAAAPSTQSPTTTTPVFHAPATAYTQQKSDTATASGGDGVDGGRGHENAYAPLDSGREGERAFRVRHSGSGDGGEGTKTREAEGGGVGAGMGGVSGAAELERVLEAERARHERELGQEREAAEARMTALKLRLVQTAQALGKAQAREQAASWGRGKDAAAPGPPLNTNTSANNIPDSSAAAHPWHTAGGAGDPHTMAIAAAEAAAEARERARVLELQAAVADERRAAAAKDLRRSEDVRRRLEAEVLALRAKVSEPSTPSQLKYTDLARKVEEMERRTARREGELQRVLEESRQQSKIELSRLQALHAEEMGAKDALVHGFRAELDALLRAAAQFMNGAGAASAATTASGGTGIGGGAGRPGRDGVGGVGNDGTSPPWGLVS